MYNQTVEGSLIPRVKLSEKDLIYHYKVEVPRENGFLIKDEELLPYKRKNSKMGELDKGLPIKFRYDDKDINLFFNTN